MFGFAVARSSLVAFLSSQSRYCNNIRTTNVCTTLQQPNFFSSSALSATTKYLLNYDYIPDVLEKRGPYREGHLNLAKDLIAEGKCLSGGPSGDPGMEVPSGALFIFTDLESAKKFLKEDPYVENGIVTSHKITEWNVVVEKE